MHYVCIYVHRHTCVCVKYYNMLRQTSIHTQGMGVAHCDISAENALGQPRSAIGTGFESNMSFRLRMFGWLELEPRSIDILHAISHYITIYPVLPAARILRFDNGEMEAWGRIETILARLGTRSSGSDDLTTNRKATNAFSIDFH